MTRKFELTISPDYVQDWGVVDAVRELFQNALDQETIDPTNRMFFDYDESEQTLRIGNLHSELEIKSLLFGGSTKRDDENTIGNFGEGYKLASLVLIRSDHPITFYNYGKKEVWKPRFVNSRRYDAKILTFFVDKYIWNKVPSNNLEILVENIDEETYAYICISNLHITKPSDFTLVPQGRILWESEFKGNIYVNGLIVEHRVDLSQGYDFLPKYLKLGRDRRSPKDWDLRYLIGEMLSNASESKGRIKELLISDAKDAEYAHYHLDKNSDMSKELIADFVQEHGEKAVPVTSEWHKSSIEGMYTDVECIIVNKGLNEILGEINRDHLTPVPEEPEEIVDEISVVSILEKWYKDLTETVLLTDELKTDWLYVLEEVQTLEDREEEED